MKFAIALLLLVAAVHGRGTSVQVENSQRSLAATGEKPWVVHLRLAVATGGLLNSCIGALIDARWVLTSALCVRDIRFIWVRLNAVEVIRPQFVYETSSVIVHSDYDAFTGNSDIALINLNREVELSENIAVIPLPPASTPIFVRGNYCAYGETEARTAGEWLSCWDVDVIAINNESVTVRGIGNAATAHDTGAPLVYEGALVGVLSQGTGPNEAVFTRTSAHVNWIAGMTGISLGRSAPQPEDTAVNFVN